MRRTPVIEPDRGSFPGTVLACRERGELKEDVLSIGLGFLVAWLMVTGINDAYRVTWLAPEYFAALALSLLLALGAVSATFSLIRGNTAITVTRFE